MGPNTELRAARTAVPSPTFAGEPMSRAELAEAVNAELWRSTKRHYCLDAHAIARYERGAVRWPSSAYRSALRAVLGKVTDAELGFVPTRRGAVARPGAGQLAAYPAGSLHAADAVVPVTNGEERTVCVPPTRRDLFRGFGAAAGIAACGGCAAGPTDSGDGLVGHFRQLRRTLADNDNLFGARGVVAVAAEQLDRMRGFNDSLRGGARRDSFQVQAEFADLLGWLHQDSGDHAAAQYWLGRALEFAHLSDSETSVAFILSRKSQLAADMDDRVVAVFSGEAGVRLGSPNPRIAAISATQAAHGHALAGDADKSEQMFAHARELFSGHAGDDSPWGRFFGLPYLDVYRAHSRAALGHHQAAADGYEAAVRTVPSGFRRDQGVYQAHQAHAHARSGDHDRAVAVGVQALAMNAETGSDRGWRELVKMRTTWGASDSAAARTFCAAMNDSIADQEGARRGRPT